MRAGLCLVAVTSLILVGACSGGGSDDNIATADTAATTAGESQPTAEPEPTATPEPQPTATLAPQPTDAPEPEPTAVTTAPKPVGRVRPPSTPVRAVLDDSYDFLGGAPDPALLPAQVGEVEAYWYRAGDVMAVVYVGLDARVNACPGNSALLSTEFQFVSNAELVSGACPDFPNLIASNASQGVQVCNGQVGYLTLIPSDTSGQVFASIEKPVPDIEGVGLTGSATIGDPAEVPEIDPTLLAC